MLNIRMRLLMCWLTVFVLSSSGSGTVQAGTISTMVQLFSLPVEAPTGVALDAEETLYVVESTLKRVAVIDNSGSRIAEINGFNKPKCVEVDGTGRVYVSDNGSKNVTVFGPDLVIQGKLGIGDGEFLKPLGIAVSTAGDVYVVDSDRSQVRVYSPDRQLKKQFGVSGSAAGQFRNPISIVVDKGTNEIIVLDLPLVPGANNTSYEGSRIQIFDSTGKYLRGFGQNGIGEGKLAKAVAVTTDNSGKIYVSDAGQDIVVVYSRTGSYIETVYDANANMRTPVGVAIGGISGRMFVSSVSLSQVAVYGQQIQHVVNAECTAGGTITPSGAIPVPHGAAADFKITAAAGYLVIGVYIDGVNVGAVTEYQIPVVVADHTVRAEFGVDGHTVLVESEGNGIVSPSGVLTVLKQGNLTLAITPDVGFRVANVVVDGISIGALDSYTLNNVTADHTVLVVFAQIPHQIIATTGEHGNITPNGVVNVEHGSDSTFNFTPQSGYRVAGVTVDGRQMGPLTSFTFTNTLANHEINVTFSRNTYQILASSSLGGNIQPAGVIAVEDGSSLDFTFGPEPGYRLSKVLVDGQQVVADNLYLFSNIVGPHSIQVEYTRIYYKIVITSEGKGSAEPAGSIDVAHGDSLTIEFGPDTGYHVGGVQVDGRAIEPCDFYPFSDVRTNHTLAVKFIKYNEPPVALAGPEQFLEASTKTITLNGAHSFDPDGEIRMFLWEQTGGMPVELPDSTAATISFPAPVPGNKGVTLEFRLTVTDDQGVSAQDTCLVNLVRKFLPPLADAGANQNVRGGETVILDGRGSVDEYGIAAYLWQQISGEPVELVDPAASVTSFVAPNGVISSLAFRLVVTNNKGLKATSNCRVNVSAGGSPPVAEAGADLVVREGDVVELNALSDDNDAVRSYLWKQTQGTPMVSLNNYTSPNASFIAPEVNNNSGVVNVYHLEVTDEDGLVASDNVTVRIYKSLTRSMVIGTVILTPGSNNLIVDIKLTQNRLDELIDYNSLALTRVNGRNISPPIIRTGPVVIKDLNRDGIKDLRMKFYQKKLASVLTAGNTVTLSGKLTDGTAFQKEFLIGSVK